MGPEYNPLHNGKKVFMTGFLTVDSPPIQDALFQVQPTLMHQPWLERRVSVHAWKENITHIEERKGDMVRRGKKCTYSPVWVDT